MGSTLKTLKILFCLVVLALPVSFAQHVYLGGTVGTPLSSTFNSPLDYAELGAQLGFDPLPGFGVRVSAEGNPVNGGLKLASGDAVFRFFLPLSYHSFYTGLGADALFNAPPTSLSSLQDAQLVAHALGGFELRLIGGFGVFGEIVPSYLIGSDFISRSAYFVRLRGGLNFHFF